MWLSLCKSVTNIDSPGNTMYIITWPIAVGGSRWARCFVLFCFIAVVCLFCFCQLNFWFCRISHFATSHYSDMRWTASSRSNAVSGETCWLMISPTDLVSWRCDWLANSKLNNWLNRFLICKKCKFVRLEIINTKPDYIVRELSIDIHCFKRARYKSVMDLACKPATRSES